MFWWMIAGWAFAFLQGFFWLTFMCRMNSKNTLVELQLQKLLSEANDRAERLATDGGHSLWMLKEAEQQAASYRDKYLKAILNASPSTDEPRPRRLDINVKGRGITRKVRIGNG